MRTINQLLLIGFLLISQTSISQDWLGFNSSNYSGINGVQYQPASIVDSRYKFQLNLAGASFYGSNNYFKLPNRLFKISELSNLNFSINDLIISNKGRDNGAFVSIDFHAPLSFMVSLSNKHAIALTARARAVINIEGVSAELAQFAQDANDTGVFVIDPFDSYDLTGLIVQAQGWAEYGLTYSRVVFDKETSFLKAGTTLKLLSGQASGYVFSKNAKIDGLQNNEISLQNINIQSGVSKPFSITNDNIYTSDPFQNTGFGIDIGAVYEYRPNIANYRYDMDGEKGLLRRDRNKYKYKIGFSLLDVGGIKYDKSNDSGNFTGNVVSLNIDSLDGDINRILDSLFTYETGGTYKMSLPTRLVSEFDYHVAKGFYVNLSGQIALNRGDSDNEKSSHLSALALTPRLEGKIFGIALPVSYDRNSNLVSGFSLRLGPLVVGSRDGLSNFIFGRNPSSADIHVALRFGLPYNKKRDSDKDGVSNKKDVCKEVPGVWEFMGCPDSDLDGIQDSEDSCPNVAGLKEFQGCPDTDNDGLRDSDDECPEIAGTLELKGCPDTDEDGIKDANDECPDEAGLVEFNGCPDTDNDGVKDSMDKCPELAGDPERDGCPDSDGDGLYDNKDNCVNEPGPVENNGCPFEDKDNDGVIDNEDECPEIKGTVENNGCPEIQEEEQEVLNTAFEQLEFKTGSSVIATSSYTSLVELSNLLKKRPDWRLRIDGHTDNTGSTSTNLRISKKRAQAVSTFLEAQSIVLERFEINGYGPEKPIADNKTSAGRQKNRRVEMTIIFE